MPRRAAAATLLLAACAASPGVEPAPRYEPSGFLGDYSRLEPGHGDQALARFIDPEADFGDYARVQIDPVTVWRRREAADDAPSEAEARRLAQRLETTLREELAHDFEIVERPGPNTLRIRAALTEARGTPLAIGRDAAAETAGAAAAPGPATRALVGVAAIEVEVLDAPSGRRLVAAVDERAFGRSTPAGEGSWSDIEAVVDTWAARIATRLAILRNVDAAEQARNAAAP